MATRKRKFLSAISLVMLKAPFTSQPTEILRRTALCWRYLGRKGGLVFVTDYERDKRWVRTFMMNADKPGDTPKLVWSRNQQDRYNDPGTPVMRTLANSQRAMLSVWRVDLLYG